MSEGEYTICEYCGKIHNGWCERIQSIEYFENGNTKKVTLHTPVTEPLDPDGWRNPPETRVRESER